MSWRAAFRQRLLADGAVSIAGKGVSYMFRPQGSELPWLVLQVVSDGREQHLEGFADRSPARVQIDALARSSTEAATLADAAIAAITPPGTFFGTGFGRAIIEPRPDGGEQGETEGIHRVGFDALFWKE